MNGDLNMGVVDWDDGLGDFDSLEREIGGWSEWFDGRIIDRTGPDPTWLDYTQGRADGQFEIRGSRTEIFAIYIQNPRPDVVLTISTLESGELFSDDGRHFSDMNIWESSSTPTLGITPQAIEDGAEWGGQGQNAPDGSGGVIVGSIPIYQRQPDFTQNVLFELRSGQNFNAITDVSTLTQIRDPMGLGSGIIYPETPEEVILTHSFDIREYVKPGINISEYNISKIYDDGRLMDPEELKTLQMGKIIVAGTVTRVNTPGSIKTLEMGFLWGNLDVAQNLGNLILRAGGGGFDTTRNTDPFSEMVSPAGGSLINVGGTLDMVMVNGFSMENEIEFYSAIEVGSNPDSAPVDPVGSIEELEYKARDYSTNNEIELDMYWRYGWMIDLDNDNTRNAQFLNYPTGDFTLEGQLVQYRETGGGGFENDVDWYALTLMAGQTIQIDGYFTYTGGSSTCNPYIAAHLYEPGRFYSEDIESQISEETNWLASFGYETIEDWGVGSRGETLKPLTLTAPSAGVYYLKVFNYYNSDEANYHLKFTNATAAALGAVNIVGDYTGMGTVPYYTNIDEYGNYALANREGVLYFPNNYFGSIPVNWLPQIKQHGYTAFNHGASGADTLNINTRLGGDIGAVLIYGNSYWTNVRTLEGGDIICFEAYEIGTRLFDNLDAYTSNTIISDGNIGRVASTGSFLSAKIEAGASTGQFNDNDNAHIQNIYVATDYVWDHDYKWHGYSRDEIVASGSIGVIEVGGNLNYEEITEKHESNFQIRANSDEIGPGGHIDLITVGGNFYRPHLYHGPGGDIGYIKVEGEIWIEKRRGWWGIATETVISDGSTATLNDDGGGTLRIEPGIYHNIPATYAYTYIPVEDAAAGIGGVIANLRVEGVTRMYATGQVQISNFDIRGTQASSDSDQNNIQAVSQTFIDGPGNVDIYYLDGQPIDEISGAGAELVGIKLFANNTFGGIISGSLGHAYTIRLKGDIGQLDTGHTGAWLFGNTQAPTVDEDDIIYEPQYGWFHNRVNGLNVLGSLFYLYVGGALGDLRVEGRLGTVKVNWNAEINQRDVTQGTDWDDWDGINGLVWSGVRIDYVDVGDGLADDGSSDLARAGIMCTRTIGEVYIYGNRIERQPYAGLGRNETLKEAMVFGEINGAILAGGDDILPTIRITTYRDSLGQEIMEPVETTSYRAYEAITKVSGEGSTLTAIVASTNLDAFWCHKYEDFSFNGTVREVRFYGTGAMIYGAEIYGTLVYNVIADRNTYGIYNSFISGDSNIIPDIHLSGYSPRHNRYPVRQVRAGGIGLFNTHITASGGDIYRIETTNSAGQIIYSSFASGGGLRTLITGDIIGSTFNIPGTLNSVRVARGIEGSSFNAGAIKQLFVGQDFLDNSLNVAGELTRMTINGRFDSDLVMQGPSTSYLRNLTVNGDIAGSITSHGYIGSIYSRRGEISADIKTISSNGNGNIAYIRANKGFTGSLEVEGSLRALITNSSMGTNPAENFGQIQTINILGDLGYLYARGTRLSQSHLFADVNVGGSCKTINIDGTLYADININGDLNSLKVKGALGGDPGELTGNPFGVRGNITVFGNLRSLRFDAGKDIQTNITAGGTIRNIRTKGGSILGDITSLFGSIENVTVMDADIIGNLTAASLRRVRVTRGDIIGNITAENGNIREVKVINGNLIGDVTATNGRIETLMVQDGNIADSSNIHADGGIRRIMVRKGRLGGGNFDGNVYSGRDIETIVVKGNLTGVKINAETYIKQIKVDGTIFDSSIRSGGQIKFFEATNMFSSVVSSAWDIERFRVRENMVMSYLMAGYDIGADLEKFNTDDNPLNNGLVHQANIRDVYIGGMMDMSIVAAGVGPGTDNNYLSIGDNVEAAGTSSIKRMIVRGEDAFGPFPAMSVVLTDTYIDSKFTALATTAGVTVHSGISNILNGTGIDFGPDTVIGKTLTIGDLTLTLSRGRANYDEDTGELVLEETSDRSSLTIKYTGMGLYGKTINITASEDSTLSSLKIIGNVTIGDIDVDGGIKTIQVGEVEDGSTWSLPGNTINSLKARKLTDVDITAGKINNLYLYENYTSGQLTVDSIKSLQLKEGDMGADMTVVLGNAERVQLRNGNLNGNLNIRGTLRNLNILGDIAGNVTIVNGDMYSLNANYFTGSVDVNNGITKNVNVREGNFAGNYQSLGIKSFRVNKGNFTGQLDSYSDLGSLNVNNGQIAGAIRVDGNIKNITAQNLAGAMVTASGDITSAKIRYNMNDSYILAGYNVYSDEPSMGNIKNVNIGGYMAASTIAAGVAPGSDGFVGTNDDKIRSTGYIYRVNVKGGIYGGSGPSYGVFAANNLPRVTSYNRLFQQSGNAHVIDLSNKAGIMHITDIRLTSHSITVTFDHPVDWDTINETTFEIIASDDMLFDKNNDIVVTFTKPTDYAQLSYNPDNYSVTITLKGATWTTFNQILGLPDALTFQLNINGANINGTAITDIRGNDLGGIDCIKKWSFGSEVLFDVPLYLNWFGNAPTAAAMIIGYYDRLSQYSNLIEGNAATQTDQVNEAIASSGGGTYTYDPVTGAWTVITPAETGSGHIPDYALFPDIISDVIGDSGWDMSTPGVPELLDIDPHADNSLADFMLTSRHSNVVNNNSYALGESDYYGVDEGIEDYFSYKGHSADAQMLPVGTGPSRFGWEDFKNQIDAEKPMLLSIDTDGDYDQDDLDRMIIYDGTGPLAGRFVYAYFDSQGVKHPELDPTTHEPTAFDFNTVQRADTWVVAVGYDNLGQYSCYNTTDNWLHRYDFKDDAANDNYYSYYTIHDPDDVHDAEEWVNTISHVITIDVNY
jgi:hypothetical protein